MKFFYYSNVAILSFSLTVLGGVIRHYSTVPGIFYAGLTLAFLVLILGVLPYRIRVKNPYLSEFLVVFCSLILGVGLWF